ncbi:GNAT family acetyltransferase [Roseibium sp.]|uniref:GNAT family acetyltransferase n=1 Tax=Roseibium sp. TaxID=1936156 RepID=UPI003A96CBB6
MASTLPSDCRVVPFEESFRTDVKTLWEACGLTRPWNDPGKDIDRKLSDPVGRLFLLLKTVERKERVIGTVMAGYDGHRGSVYYLGIDPKHQGAGYGRVLMDHVEQFLLALGCPKINLFVRKGNDAATSFYEKLDFAEDNSLVLGKRLIPD